MRDYRHVPTRTRASGSCLLTRASFGLSRTRPSRPHDDPQPDGSRALTGAPLAPDGGGRARAGSDQDSQVFGVHEVRRIFVTRRAWTFPVSEWLMMGWPSSPIVIEGPQPWFPSVPMADEVDDVHPTS